MIYTDTHAHVYSEEFLEDLESCHDRSLQNGVSRVFVPNIDEGSVSVMKEVCKRFPENYFPMMGLHPCSVKNHWADQLKHIHDEFISNRYIGIGEIGMDLYWDKTTYEIQRRAFLEQAQWAMAADLPVSIHSREATRELIAIIRAENLKRLRGVFHCFTGNEEEAEELIKMGFYLGIGGVITYKNSQLPPVIARIGTSHLVLETDAPYLPPVPYRGKRNETSYIPLIAQKLAEILSVPTEQIAEITTKNSKDIFGI